MPETNAESGKKPLSRRVASPPPIVLVLFLLALALGCRTASSPDDSDQASSNRPEITDETVSERLIGSRVWDVPEENGAQEPITWNFDYDEPREITVVERSVEGDRATIILDVKTSSVPRARNQRVLSGRIRTGWELRTGWVLRRWEIVDIENLSMKYRTVARQSATDNLPAAAGTSPSPPGR